MKGIEYSHVSANGKDFIKKALIKDQNKRPSAAQLLKHKWIQNKVVASIDDAAMTATLGSLNKFSKSNKFQKSIVSLMHNLLSDKDEIRQVTEIFKKLDADSNGQLSKEEL